MTVILNSAVRGAGHTGQIITFGRRNSSEVVDLTAATITGTIRDTVTNVTRAIAGTLSGSGITGLITWTYGAGDIGTAGKYDVQFKATYGDATYELSYVTGWEVVEAL